MYVCTYVRTYMPMYLCMYVCTYVHTYVCMYVCTYYVCMYVCMYVYMYVCMYLCLCIACMYSQPHLIGAWLIGSSGSDQDFTPDNHCYDRQVASLSVITMAYQVRNLDHFLNS